MDSDIAGNSTPYESSPRARFYDELFSSLCVFTTEYRGSEGKLPITRFVNESSVTRQENLLNVFLYFCYSFAYSFRGFYKLLNDRQSRVPCPHVVGSDCVWIITHLYDDRILAGGIGAETVWKEMEQETSRTHRSGGRTKWAHLPNYKIPRTNLSDIN